MPSGKLVDVTVQVLAAHLVINAVVAPFQHRPERFDPVRVRLTVYVLAYRVLHRVMLVDFLQTLVRPVVVCIDCFPSLYGFQYEPCERFARLPA